MQLSQTSVSLDVLDKKSNVKFILKIFGLKDNTFRIRLSEAAPLRERYEPPLGDVLLQEPEGEEWVPCWLALAAHRLAHARHAGASSSGWCWCGASLNIH